MRYFAYGSNLLFSRLHARCPSIHRLGIARLAGHALSFTKPGGDQSGKCGIAAAGPGDYVLGVLYAMSVKDRLVLDEIEGVGHGYESKDIVVSAGHAPGQDAPPIHCFTYYPTLTAFDLSPFDWYKEFVVRGARENGFPDDYLQRLLAVSEREDPDQSRRALNFAILDAASAAS